MRAATRLALLAPGVLLLKAAVGVWSCASVVADLTISSAANVPMTLMVLCRFLTYEKALGLRSGRSNDVLLFGSIM
jgi:hypothetical protein